MIPTKHKSKISRHMSYPIGAEALTEGIAGAPHAESFTVSFHDSPVWPASRFQQILALRQPYKVLVAEYRPRQKPGYGASQFLIEDGWFDTKWQFTVYPVVRELRHLANRLIRDTGVSMLIQWLRSSERDGWMTREQRIEFVFDTLTKTLTAKEFSGV